MGEYYGKHKDDNFLKLIILSIISISIILLLSLGANAVIYSVEPCGETLVYQSGTGGETRLNLENDCVLLSVKKAYNPDQIILTDKYNQESFRLNLKGIEEKQSDDTTVVSTVPFDSMGLTGYLDENNNAIYWSDSDVMIGYKLEGRTFKNFAEINNYNFADPTNNLWIQMSYKTDASGYLQWIEPYADGIPQPIDIVNKTSDGVFYFQQKIGNGVSIVFDPVYTVDYSPIPALHLINGTLSSSPDSAFQYQIDITTGISDNLTSTQYTASNLNYNPSGGVMIIDTAEDVYTSTDYAVTWNEVNTNFADDISNAIELSTSPNGKYYVVTLDRNVWEGTNGGVNWTKTINDFAGESGDPTGITIDNSGYIYIGTAQEEIYRSTNDGVSFTKVNVDINGVVDGSPIDSLGHNPLTDCISAIMGDEEFYRSCNQGVNWTLINSDALNTEGTLQENFLAVDYQGYIYIVSGQKLFESTNAGVSFTKINADFNGGSDSNNARSITKVGNDIYICDGGEDIYLGDDSGAVFTEQIDNFNGADSDCKAMTSLDYISIQSRKAITGKWSQTYNPVYNWYLRVQKETSGTGNVSVYAYNDTNNLSSQYVTKNLMGTGWFNINVSGLMNYMTNTLSLNYTMLRFWMDTTSSNFSEIRLRAEANDTQEPTISNCHIYESDTNFTDITEIGCSNDFHLHCTVTDDLDVDMVLFQINGVNYTATQHNSDYGYNFILPVNGSIIYDFEMVYAEDISGNWNSTDPNLQVNFTCITCSEDWVEDTIVCLINDTYLSTYTDNNACGTVDDLPAQNGTYPYCNYCSEDLVQTLGTCLSNSTQTVDWADNNYFSCCAVTGLMSDCSILYYPYNETTSQSCILYESELGNISCQNEPNFNIREKEYCLAWIPNQYLNETFKCISYVIEQSSSEILQTNPEYRERTSTWFELGQDPETREYFAPANAIVNFYYTNKNLLPEQDYTLTIECSSVQRTLKSEIGFQIAYENYEFVFFRTRWLMANAGYIIAGILVLFIIVALFILLFKGAR